VKDSANPDSKTAFFDYSSEDGPTSLPINGFKQHNERVLASIGKPRETKEYFYNTRRELY